MCSVAHHGGEYGEVDRPPFPWASIRSDRSIHPSSQKIFYLPTATRVDAFVTHLTREERLRLTQASCPPRMEPTSVLRDLVPIVVSGTPCDLKYSRQTALRTYLCATHYSLCWTRQLWCTNQRQQIILLSTNLYTVSSWLDPPLRSNRVVAHPHSHILYQIRRHGHGGQQQRDQSNGNLN